MYSDVKQLFSSSSCEIQNYEETKQISGGEERTKWASPLINGIKKKNLVS